MHDIRTLFTLDGKRALITGSTRGLGYVLARGLLDAGATVVINGRSDASVDHAVTALHEDFENDERVGGVPFDVTDEKGVENGIRDVEDLVGDIDILINNAGIQERGPLDEIESTRFKSVIDVNLIAPFLVARTVARGMIKRGSGKIINICSLMSEIGRNTVGPYTAAKGGLKMLTRAMTVDWARHGLQINGIGPGYFITDMTKPLAEDERFDTWLKNRTPAARWGDPEELVGPAVFLASDASSFVNGQIIYVDGGILASL